MLGVGFGVRVGGRVRAFAVVACELELDCLDARAEVGGRHRAHQLQVHALLGLGSRSGSGLGLGSGLGSGLGLGLGLVLGLPARRS